MVQLWVWGHIDLLACAVCGRCQGWRWSTVGLRAHDLECDAHVDSTTGLRGRVGYTLRDIARARGSRCRLVSGGIRKRASALALDARQPGSVSARAASMRQLQPPWPRLVLLLSFELARVIL